MDGDISDPALVIGCGGGEVRLPLAEIEDGHTVACPCGAGVTIHLAGLTEARSAFKSLRQEAEALNRKLGPLGLKVTLS